MRVVMLLISCVVVAMCMNATGERLSVPEDYASIQAAIDAAKPGDSVAVGPGTYEETLMIRKDIELKGAGADSTIVRAANGRGELLKVIDVTGGSITGFRFEHSDTASLEPNRVLFPDAVKINNSSVEIRDCTIGPSAGCGIIINQKSNSRVVECRFEGNSQAGIFVRGEGTVATLLRNECINNEWGGICLTKASKAVAEENTCFNNGKWGVKALGKGTSIVLKNNACTLNRGSGIMIEQWANGVVEDNTCRENDGDGIIFKLGANGTVVGNTLEKNTWSGIIVQSLAVNVEVHNNTCNGNEHNGIAVCWGASSDVTGNICNGNTWSGIVVADWFSNAIVTDNTSNENTMHGILFCRGAAGKAEGNRCQKNKLHGILVKDENTEPDIGQNVCKDNGGKDVAREEGDPISRQNQIDTDEIGCALAGEHFEELEKMADWLRQHKCRHSNGWWQLSWFYEGLRKGCGDISPKQRDEFTAVIERWKEAYPKSVAPLITQAEVHSAYGWDARGSGYANTVSQEGWDIFHKEMDIAEGYLLEAEALNGNDPHLYTLMIDVSKSLDSSDKDLRDMFDKGAAIDVGYHPLHHTMAWNLTHRWGGRRGELEHFAEKVFDLTREEYGHTLYALLVGRMATKLLEEDFLEDHSFDREKVDKGYAELFEAFPESNYFLNQYCQLACYYSEQETARELFDKIGENMDESVWWNKSRFSKWKKWAIGTARIPHRGSTDRGLDSSPDVSMRDALLNEIKLLFESVSWVEGAVLSALLFVAIVFVLYSAKKKRRQPPTPPEPLHENDSQEDDSTPE